MMLTLIAATKNQISLPEPSIVDERPVLTPLALRHFPSGHFASARKRFLCSQGLYDEQDAFLRIPSLVELILHSHRVSPHCEITDKVSGQRYARAIKAEDEIQALPLGELLRANTPFYHHYPGEPHNRERAKRKAPELGPKIMYLTSATLVVVPPNLVSQWDREITKHCDFPLRVLILRAKTPLPSIRELANDYDVSSVLFCSHLRVHGLQIDYFDDLHSLVIHFFLFLSIWMVTFTGFTAESNVQGMPNMHTQIACTCPEFPFSRVPNCSCQVPGVSPFLQIRWKRLIIDEGHVSSTLSTNLVPFAKILSVERRWIVTGTPTTNLLGLSLGTKTAEPVPTTHVDWSSIEDAEEASGTTSSISTAVNSPAGSPPPNFPGKRIWNKYDREDLSKLGNMISHFIAVPQFSADSKLISSHVIEPLLDPSGPRNGAIQVLNQVMGMAMIRHRIEDVEKEVVLPPVTHESILLDLDPFVIKSFNALQAAIVVNAIDSQRTDQVCLPDSS